MHLFYSSSFLLPVGLSWPLEMYVLLKHLSEKAAITAFIRQRRAKHPGDTVCAGSSFFKSLRAVFKDAVVQPLLKTLLVC